MNFNKSTQYALYAAMEMAAAGTDSQVTAAHVAERHSIPGTVLAKVFQHLVHAGVAVGTRGIGGGYQLAKKPSELTMLDVIQVFEPLSSPGANLLDGDGEIPLSDPNELRLRMVFDEVNELVRCTFASITLETLVGSRSPLALELKQPPLLDPPGRRP